MNQFDSVGFNSYIYMKYKILLFIIYLNDILLMIDFSINLVINFDHRYNRIKYLF